MSESMIERVARAMIVPLGHDPAINWARTYIGGGCEGQGDDASLRRLCFDLARAAIAAMREPTDDMLNAGCDISYFADQSWPTMIDAALA